MDSNYIQGLRGLHAEHAHQQDGLLLVPLQGAGGRRQGVQQGCNSTHTPNKHDKKYHKILVKKSKKMKKYEEIIRLHRSFFANLMILMVV